jgi:sulfur relay (sulfurtransferase) complex TusBCD TusD component (DsrE family)
MMNMKKVLILINDAPYGTEKAYNALRLAMQIQKDYEGTDVCVFLMADAVPYQIRILPTGIIILKEC